MDFELGSDEWWIDFLARRMGATFTNLTTLKSYREGTNALPGYATGQSLANYSNVLDISRLNFADQLASALANQGRPIGFRTAAEDDRRGDKVAEALWKRSWMGTQYSVLANTVCTYGRAYMTVIENEQTGEDAYPFLSVASPWEAYTYADPRRPWIVQAAIMVGWNPETSRDSVILMRRDPGAEGDAGQQPDGLIAPVSDGLAYYRVVSILREDGASQLDTTQAWEPDFSDWEWGEPQQFRTSDVPIVPFTTDDGFGVFEKHMATLDRINHTILQRVVITIMQAFRQRAIDGDFDDVYPEGHEQAGEPIDWDSVFEAGPDALWRLPAGAKMWESATTDIRPIIEAIQSDLKHLAAATSTPLYVLSPESANGSAEGAGLARETHALKAESLRLRFDDALAQALAIAFASMGDEARSVAEGITTIWHSGASISMMERSAAAAQLKAAGVSGQSIQEFALGMTPEQQERERLALSDESMALGAGGGSAPAASGIARVSPPQQQALPAAPTTPTPDATATP